jgi:hypothetical protein
MKGNKQTYRTLEQLVDGVLMDRGQGAHRKEQCLRWGIQEMERWRMDMAREVKTVKLELTDWKAIELPADCIDWIKVGIQDGNVIKAFVNKRDVAIHHDLDENNVPIVNSEPASLTVDSSCPTVPFYNYQSGGQDPGQIFGQLVKDNGLGYFTVNRNDDRDEIQFRTNTAAGSAIYLEYLSDSWSPDKQSAVHPYSAELIELGIHYRMLKFDKANGNRSVSADDVRLAKNDYQEEYNRVIDRLWDYSVEDIIDMMTEGYMLTANPQ